MAQQPPSPAMITLEATRARLDRMATVLPNIERAAQLIHQAPHRVIVTGMGKCAHIGRKITATLQSTGQPAAFLHPGEALHGDLGMIEPGDAILALSNSGQTSEVLHVANYGHRTGPLIVITGQEESPLAHKADALILIPDGPEGDSLDRAPMASSTAMLVAGDMLASQLMAARGFTEQQFLALHHGGYLGQMIRGDHAAG